MAEKRSGRRGERGRGNGNERGYPRRRSEKRIQRAGDGEKSEKGGGAGKEIRTRGKEKFGKELKKKYM